MNYLAHSFLSNNNTELLIGNFVADHIRIKAADHLPLGIQKGIILHRRIDNYTDSHPLFINSKRFFYDGFERYSGVLMDIYFDHVLAQRFEKYSNVKLQDYVNNVYNILQQNKMYLPESAAKFLEYAVKYNTFFEYSKIDGIELVLKHLSYRINHGIDLSKSVPLFTINKEQIEKDFFGFMIDMQDFVKNEIKKL